MNGNELKQIFEQLDERGQSTVAAVALAELKHTREGLYLPRGGTLEVQTHNSIIARQNDEIKGGDDDNEA